MGGTVLPAVMALVLVLANAAAATPAFAQEAVATGPRAVDCDRVQAAAAAGSAQGADGKVDPGGAAAIARELDASPKRVAVCLESGVPLEGVGAATAGAVSRPADDAPDYGSAEDVPSNPDYQITAADYLIYQGDMVVGCGSVWPGNYTSTDLYEEQAGICTDAGFPPRRPPPSEWVSLPTTGGLPLLLAPSVLLLGAAGLLARAIASR